MIPPVEQQRAPQTLEPQRPETCGRWQKIGTIALKVLATTSIVLGSCAAIAGAIVVTSLAAGTGILAPLFIPCITGAAYMTQFSLELLKSEVTSMGVMFTLPLAAVCLSPFLLPIAVGAAPGGALIGLGAWGWSQLS